MANCIIITAIICVLVTTVATIVSFATPNWISIETSLGSKAKDLCSCANCDCGLWLHCTDGYASDASIDNCKWFFSNDFEIEKKLPDWFKAVQGLMACAVATSLLSLTIGLFSLCCYCKNCNPHHAAGSFITLTFLLIAAAVSVFGAKCHLDVDLKVISDDTYSVALFAWSFWLAVGAGGMAGISSILYCCVGRQEEYV